VIRVYDEAMAFTSRAKTNIQLVPNLLRLLKI
jgi:hypothetical protein